MREKGNTDGRKKIRGVRGEQGETHTTELQGEMQSPNPTFPAEGKGLLLLGSGRSSKMYNIKQPVEALPLHWFWLRNP